LAKLEKAIGRRGQAINRQLIAIATLELGDISRMVEPATLIAISVRPD
jgi:hypothetical protein